MKSEFYALNSYLLLEYIHFDDENPTQWSHTTDPWIRIKDKQSNEYQLLNGDTSSNTNNIREHSVVKLDNNQWAWLDTTPAVNYLDQNAAKFNWTTLDNSNQDINLNGNFNPAISFIQNPRLIKYDSVRIHVLQGYTFDDVDGYIIEIGNNTDLKRLLYTSRIVILKNSNWYQFNAKPKIFNGKYYNVYFEWQVPSINKLIEDYTFANANPLNSIDLVNSNYNKITREQPFNINFYSIIKTDIKVISSDSYYFFYSKLEQQLSINQIDEFSLLSCNIIEAESPNDYFEYYATYNGELIADYMDYLNNSGGNWILQHELKISEQIGLNWEITDEWVTLQLTDFNKIKRFRPVIINAYNAVSFAIDYTIKLINVDTGKTVSRNASLTSSNVKLYGPELLKIDLSRNPAFLQKVYNQRSNPLQLNIANSNVSNTITEKIVPTFYDRLNIVIGSQVLYLDSNGNFTTEAVTNTNILWPNDQLQIELQPFDNWFLFKVYTQKDSVVKELNLSSSNSFYLYFDDKNNFLVQNSNISSISRGELLFKIPKSSAIEIIKQSKGKFYLLSTFAGESTQLYSGFWRITSTDYTIRQSELQAVQPVSFSSASSSSQSVVTSSNSVNAIEPNTTGTTLKNGIKPS